MASDIRNLLFSHGFGRIWLCQTLGDVDRFINEFRVRAIDMFGQDWNSTLDSSSSYEYYRTFKTLLQPEKYLSLITKYRLRTLFVKYRLSL